MTPLRAHREKHRLTLGEVAAGLDISEGQLSRVEREGTNVLDLALRLAELTGEPVERFAREGAATATP